MNLDYHTILFFFVLTNIFNIALFVYQYFFHHKKWYLAVFITGILFQTIALYLIGHRNTLPSLLSVQISNFFLISSFAFTTFGIISFDGKIRKNIIWFFIVFTLLFYISFLLKAEDFKIRIIIQTLACSFFYGIAAVYLFIHKEKYKFSIIISSALIIYSIFQLFRISVLYHVEQPYDFLKGSTIDNWYLSISLFVISTLRIGFIMLLKEIDQKTILQINAKLQQHKHQLEELNQTKDKLFSIIAHDLRNPFNTILGFSELAIENRKKKRKTESEKYLSIIHSSAQNTLILLDNLLHWSKSQTGKIIYTHKKIVLSSIIGETIELSNSTALAKGISLNQNNPKEIEVYADEEMLKVVLRNLISNAIKFTHINGKINIYERVNDSYIEITVADNGVGMNEETQKNLFNIETNISTNGTAKEKGSGIGLILCQEIVEKNGGDIWVESELGKGSHFKFTIPIWREQTALI